MEFYQFRGNFEDVFFSHCFSYVLVNQTADVFIEMSNIWDKTVDATARIFVVKVHVVKIEDEAPFEVVRARKENIGHDADGSETVDRSRNERSENVRIFAFDLKRNHRERFIREVEFYLKSFFENVGAAAGRCQPSPSSFLQRYFHVDRKTFRQYAHKGSSGGGNVYEYNEHVHHEKFSVVENKKLGPVFFE